MNSTNSTIGIGSPTNDADGVLYRTIGICLAISSGVFIGSSFVFKKKGLLDAMKVEGAVAGEGHGYLKNPLWWIGMTLMIIGEVCNFVAYAFTQAILVTPLGALSVVISAVLSSIFLNERLNFQGKVGCALCIIGATIIVLHAPEQKTSESSIADFERLALAPGFLTFAILDILGSFVLIFYAGPRWGKKNIFIYILVCSMIGGLSVVSTQGLGAAIVNSIGTHNYEEFKHVSLYVLLVFVIVTLLTEINYLNKALNLFNTALVTPIYYVIFTSMTIISSAILFQGFNASVADIITLVLGFLVICAGILLLQTSRSHDPGMLADADRVMIQGADAVDEEEEKTRMLDPSIMELRANPFGSIRRFSRYERDPPPPIRTSTSITGGMHIRRRSMLDTVNETNVDLERGEETPKTPKRFSAANRSATIAVGGGRDGVRMYHLGPHVVKRHSSDRDTSSGGDSSSTPISPFSTYSSHATNPLDNLNTPTPQRHRTSIKFNSIPELEPTSLIKLDNETYNTVPAPKIPPPPAPPHQPIAAVFPDSPHESSVSTPVSGASDSPPMRPSSPIQNITSYFSSFLGSSRPANSTGTNTGGSGTTVEAATHARAGSSSSIPSLHSHRPPIGPIDQLRMGISREEDGDHKRLVGGSVGSNEDENGQELSGRSLKF